MNLDRFQNLLNLYANLNCTCDMWICHVLDMSCLENDPSGLCYAGMLIHFCSDEFQALDMSIF